MKMLILDDAAYLSLADLNAASAKKRFQQLTPVQLADGTYALNADALGSATWAEHDSLLKTLIVRDVADSELVQSKNDFDATKDLKPVPVKK